MLGDRCLEEGEPRLLGRFRAAGASMGASLDEGVVVPDVGTFWGRGVRGVMGVIWKFIWIGTERTRRWGRGDGDVDI